MPTLKKREHREDTSHGQRQKKNGAALKKSKERSLAKKRQKLERKEKRNVKNKGAFGSE